MTNIPNHYAPKLSALDLEIVSHVPEGGNWKNIPDTVPSQRLAQIRESFKRGEGSRSTYYGRLKRDAPAYTISTYFTRPGNGCHIHYDQDRVLSEREAARLQSFPDSFAFSGSHSQVAKQIGNAVPPLLALQIASGIGKAVDFVDLFAGAGGMALGFTWAGSMPILANDIEPSFLATYAANIHPSTVCGSITDPSIFDAMVKIVKEQRRTDHPLWVIGGPPCQGFSTAGNARSMEDPRNHLFKAYVDFLKEIQPDGFIFENVTGLLNMNGGSVFQAVKKAFAEVMPHIEAQVLCADEYGIPQRRKRVILAGVRNVGDFKWPVPLTAASVDATLFGPRSPWISVKEALSDLPPLSPGEDGSEKDYATTTLTDYQKFCRGFLKPEEYLTKVRNR